MKRSFLRTTLAVGAMAGSLALATSDGARAAGDVTFTVGTVQDVDSLNVTVGVLVIDYEVWNITLPTLTDKAADDFSVQPGLAESWSKSDDGLTWTYKLREGAKWSDGEPMTADDVVYTIERANAEEWANHLSTTVNLTATAPDPQTVVITTSVPDPKLPVMDFYIVPKHIYEKISADDLPNYTADDNVSGGPFMITDRQEGEFVKLERNPNWYGKTPAIDTVIYRIFANAEAQYTALTSGDIDAVDDVPVKIYADIVAGKVDNIAAIGGNQGSFSELAMNAGCETGIGDGHVALKDPLVRQAINWAIDRDLLVDKVLGGFGKPAYALISSANPAFDLKLPAGVEQYKYDPEKAKALLDQAGWTDADGDGVREKDGVELKLRYFDRSNGNGTATTGFITGWLNDVGIGTEVTTYDNDTLTAIQGKGEYDLFEWGWTPFVDPDPELSYFTTDSVSTDPEVGGYNDANWCNSEYDDLYQQQKVELDPAKRADLINQALTVFYNDAPYAVLYKYDDLQAIRSDRWENWARQPKDTGPALFTNTSPSYVTLTPTSGGGDDSSSTGVIIGVIIGVIVLAGGAFLIMRSRKKTADERE